MSKSHKLSLDIPLELQIEILMRLPVKSLMRFKSVSKLWSSLICSQDFTDGFLKVSSSLLCIYMWLGFGNKKVLLSASSSPPDSDLSSIVVDQDLTIPPMEGYSVSHVYRGLMCLVNRQSAKIYNTSTRQLVLLPDIEESTLIAENHKMKKIMYHIGHDPVYNQYKVICTVSRSSDEVGTYMSEHWVLLLGRDRSSRWRKIANSCQPHHTLTQGLTINGRMYYFAWVRLLYPVLVSLDIHSEEISILQEPEDQAFWPRFAHLIQYGGRVAIVRHSDFEDEGVMDLWVMEDEENNSWSKKTLVLHPSQMHILNGISLRVQGTTRKGEVIFVPHNISGNPMRTIVVEPQSTTLFHVFLYNLQTNFLRKVEIKDTSNRYLTKIWDVIGWDDVENLMYL